MKSRADYDTAFEDILHFKTPEETEASLRRLDALYGKFRREGDRMGAARAVAEVQKGLKRARMISRNRKVAEEKRRQKEEAALWFETWLACGGGEAFWTWLRMRKASVSD